MNTSVAKTPRPTTKRGLYRRVARLFLAGKSTRQIARIVGRSQSCIVGLKDNPLFHQILTELEAELYSESDRALKAADRRLLRALATGRESGSG